MTRTDEQQRIKGELVRARGTWGEPCQRMLELDPAVVRAYLDLSAVPWRRGARRLRHAVRHRIRRPRRDRPDRGASGPPTEPLA